MSFALEIKEELLLSLSPRPCCLETFLKAGVFFGERPGNVLEFRGASIGRALVFLLKSQRIERWGMGLSRQGKGVRRGRIILGEKLGRLAADLPHCCEKTVLRASFLLHGSFSFPRRGYHLEITCRSHREARRLLRAWLRFGLNGHSCPRRGRRVVFLKSGDAMARFLGLLGATRSLLRFEEIRALKETKNEVRRRVNYEAANLERTIRASARLKQSIEKLGRGSAWQALPAGIRAAAQARLKYPQLSLEELAGKLRITKSALNHRFRRLEAYG